MNHSQIGEMPSLRGEKELVALRRSANALCLHGLEAAPRPPALTLTIGLWNTAVEFGFSGETYSCLASSTIFFNFVINISRLAISVTLSAAISVT